MACSVFFYSDVVLAVDEGGQPLPDLAPLPAPKPEPPALNDPPETYPGQVIIKYTQNYKEVAEDGLTPDERVLTVDVLGTIYPLYEKDYRNKMSFTGKYLFEEGQMSWSYNAKSYTMNPPCEYLTTSSGSGNIDIAHTEKIGSDSEIWLESDGEYTMDINNDGRMYLTADGLPIVEGDYDSAMKPLQMTTSLISGDPKFCAEGGVPTNEVPPIIYIRLENLKANKNILSGSEVLPSGDSVEMISYTIELPEAYQTSNSPEEPAISYDNPDKQGLLEIFRNWLRNLFN